jgi:Zn-dependent membrane protease YugP
MAGWLNVFVDAAQAYAQVARHVVGNRVQDMFQEARATPSDLGWTGWQVVTYLITQGGISPVFLECVSDGGDHYDPDRKVVCLSDDVYWGTSVFAIAVAAHEAGHAIQDATNDPAYLENREACKRARRANTIATAARFTGAGWPVIPIVSALTTRLALNSRNQVEQDASERGLERLCAYNIIRSDREKSLVYHVLKAAHSTYVIH